MKKQFRIEDYSGEYAMHCNAKEKANIFLKYLDSKGLTWSNGESYVNFTKFENYGDSTVYCFNEGKYGSKEFINNQTKILNFDDFDWHNHLTKPTPQKTFGFNNIQEIHFCKVKTLEKMIALADTKKEEDKLRKKLKEECNSFLEILEDI